MVTVQGDPRALLGCGIIFALAGLLIMSKPQWLVKMQAWQAKTFAGAQYIPSKRTFRTTRILGTIFMILGVSLLVLYALYFQKQ